MKPIRCLGGPGLGDRVYGLPLLRHLAQTKARPVHLLLHSGASYAAKMRQAVPFFASQLEGLGQVTYHPDHSPELVRPDYWLDRHLQTREQRTRARSTVVLAHFRATLTEPPPDYDAPWLTVAPSGRWPVVVHRSARYRAPGTDYSFLRDFPGMVYCVGFPAETAEVQKETGAIPIPTTDFAHLASVIAGACVFVGNQSSPLAIAVGLGKARLLEACRWWPNCWFGHANEVELGSRPQRNAEALESLLGGQKPGVQRRAMML